MVSMTTTSHGPMTRAELDALPDDGRRHELIDGVLLVTPAPRFHHQLASAGMFRILDAARPGHLVLLTAPFDVALADDTVVEPDLLVAPRVEFTEKDLPTAPLLAVEILSPSTRLIDLNLKRARYEAAGCPSYWVFDPDRLELTVWELSEDGYEPPLTASGDDVLRLSRPYPVEIRPSRTIDR
jgi:Uma2 family endonuclease